MYKRRLYSFVLLCAVFIVLCVVRLAQLQLVRGRDYRLSIEQARILDPMQLPTVRGSILDRDGNALAVDTATFSLYINYSLSRLLDDRFWKSSILVRTNDNTTPPQAESELRKSLADAPARLDKVLEVCSDFQDGNREDIRRRIEEINDRIWRMREFFAWKWCGRTSPTRTRYDADNSSVSHDDIVADLIEQYPDEKERSRLILDVNLREMTDDYRYKLLDLLPGEEVFLAQEQFGDLDGVVIDAQPSRKYPYASAACQVIGWVGVVPPQEHAIFDPNDIYTKYMTGEVGGRSGVEKICEVTLRGRRGEITYNDTGQKVNHKETQFGEDVRLSIDIRLQKRIESFLADPNENPGFDAGIGTVVIDVATGDVLALVSMPVFDLNAIRTDYAKLIKAPNKPFVSKAIAERYPPGSTVKPVLCIAALEEHKLSPSEVIHCPPQLAPEGWPNCPIVRKGGCHDWKWENTARNAIRGSCNVFFSHVADRLKPEVFQKWFFNFGYGRRILPGAYGTRDIEGLPRGMDRFLPESPGQLSAQPTRGDITSVDDLGKLYPQDLKQCGIGQGRITVTVLQVANAAAAIARRGIYKPPRLFLDDNRPAGYPEVDLGISPSSLAVVRDGMRAAVTEIGGTGYAAFSGSDLDRRDVKVFGKTGSTTGVENAWFVGFAEDPAGRAIAMAIVVEQGQSGTREAAPLAKRIIEFCNEAGHIGKRKTAN